MQSTSTFWGKCTTLFIGGCLSWFTVADPEIKAFVDRVIVGRSAPADDEIDLAIATAKRVANAREADSPESLISIATTELRDDGNARFVIHQDSSEEVVGEGEGAIPSPVDSGSSTSRMQELSAALKNLGATYLLVERFTGSGGPDGFRVRCDVMTEGSPMKCCFEATAENAVAAMEEVLRAVQGLRRHISSGVAST